MKKFFVKTLSVAMTLALGMGMTAGLAACDSGKTADGGEVTLVIWLPAEDREFGESVAAKFQAAHPEKQYTFLFGAQSESDCGTTILNDVTNAPDCFAFASDQILKLINGGALNRIGGGALERMKKQNTPESVDAATVTRNSGEAETYAFPYTDNTYFLYYDKSKFAESDLATLDGILAKCSETEQFAYPMNDGWYSSAFYFGAGLGYEVTYDDNFGETKIDTDIGTAKGLEVTKAMSSYVTNKAFKPDSDDSKLVAGFEDGSIIAGVSGVWNRNAIYEILGDNMGVADLPTYTLQGQQVQLVGFAGYKLMGVCNYSSVKADALEFAEFFTNEENQLGHFEARRFTPTNIVAAAKDEVQADPCGVATRAVLSHSKTQKGVPTTWWDPIQALGNGMITKGQGFTADSELSSAVAKIKKNV